MGSVVGPVFLSPLLLSCDVPRPYKLLLCYVVDYEQDTNEDGILPLPLPQLYDTDEDVAMEALDVLDEACEEEVSSSVV